MQSPETRIQMRFWEQLGVFKNPPSKIAKAKLFSLFLLVIYSLLAGASLLCDSVEACGADTPVGDIFIRPFIDAPNRQACSREATTDFPNNTPISESLFNQLESANFSNVADIFGNDLTKWQVSVTIGCDCDDECEMIGAFGTKIPFKKVFNRFNVDYQIVRIRTSNVPGFAIKIPKLPVAVVDFNSGVVEKKRKLVMTIEITEPCTQHVSNCSKCTTSRFAMKYTVSDTRENIERGGEIRTTLIGEREPDPKNCCN